jgi:hypothetical protein
MSPTRDIRRGPPTSRDLQVSLHIEHHAPPGHLVARLIVDEPDGLLVEIELTSDELALLLTGQTVAVPGQVSDLEHPPDDEPTVETGIAEDAQPEEAAEPEGTGQPPAEVDEPAPTAATTYSTALDEPPTDTQPITRSTDVAPGEEVLAYIRGQWRDAVIARRDISSLLVTYTRPGSFGQVQQRIATDRVRRRT